MKFNVLQEVGGDDLGSRWCNLLVIGFYWNPLTKDAKLLHTVTRLYVFEQLCPWKGWAMVERCLVTTSLGIDKTSTETTHRLHWLITLLELQRIIPHTSKRPTAIESAAPVDLRGLLPVATGQGSRWSSPNKSVRLISHLWTGWRNLHRNEIKILPATF